MGHAATEGCPGDTCKGQLGTWSGTQSAGPLAVGMWTHGPGEAAAPRGPGRRVWGSVRRGAGLGGAAGSRDSEGTVWGQGRGQSCCPGLRCGEGTVWGWGGRDSPGLGVRGHGRRFSGSLGPICVSSTWQSIHGLGRPHHACCFPSDGGAEGRDTGDAGGGTQLMDGAAKPLGTSWGPPFRLLCFCG